MCPIELLLKRVPLPLACVACLSCRVYYAERCYSDVEEMKLGFVTYSYDFATDAFKMALFVEEDDVSGDNTGEGVYAEVSADAGGVIIPVLTRFDMAAYYYNDDEEYYEVWGMGVPDAEWLLAVARGR